MLAKMQRADYRNGRNEEIKAWVEENLAIKSKIEERIRNVPAANRERAFINAAKTEAQNQTVRPNGLRPPPFRIKLRRQACLRRMAVGLAMRGGHVRAPGRAVFKIHVACIPVAAFRLALRTPVRPDPEFRVAKPFGHLVLPQ
jgi:hypothetical protein